MTGRMRYPSLFALALVAVLTGCGSTSGTGRSGADTLTEREIQDVVAANLYEVVEKLRPRWLQVRATTSLSTAAPAEIGVFVGQSHQGGVEILRTMTRDGIVGMRYMDGTRASAVLRSAGGTAFAGAIIIDRVR